MNFSLEQKLTTLFFLLGLTVGFISNYISSTLISFGIGILIFATVFSILAQKIKSKRIRWLFTNTFITYMLVWLVVWIFLFNLG